MTKTDIQSTHTDSTDGLILLTSLAEQDGGPLVRIYRSIHICRSWIPPAAGLRHSVSPVAAPRSQSSQLLAPGHVSPEVHSPTPVAGTDHHTHTHTHTELARMPLVLSSPLLVALPLQTPSAIMCPMSPGSNTFQSQRCSGVDSSEWVSILDTGAETPLGQTWEGSRQSVPSSESLIWVPTCLCAPVLLWAGADGPLMG